jgi:hypothetical protein
MENRKKPVWLKNQSRKRQAMVVVRAPTQEVAKKEEIAFSKRVGTMKDSPLYGYQRRKIDFTGFAMTTAASMADAER